MDWYAVRHIVLAWVYPNLTRTHPFDIARQGTDMFFHQAPTKSSPSKASPAFYRLRDVMRISSLSRSTIYRRISEGRFPSPVHLGGRASGWPNAELQAWINDPAGYRRTATPPR